MEEYFNILDVSFFNITILRPLLCFSIVMSIIIYNIVNKKIKHIKLVIVFSIFITILLYSIFSISIKEYITLRKIYKNNEFNIVEGFVTDFDPMPYSGRKLESFKVNNIEFHYSNFRETYAFNNAKARGGPIDEGIYVKIYYTDGISGRSGNKIIGLWIEKNNNTND